MVDTLAPKKIFTQRDLDSSLSSSNKVNTTNGSATSMVESLPKKAIVKPLINIQQPDYLIDADTVLTQMVEKSAPSTTEREQTIQSSNELTDVKQTGSQVKKDVAQGLGSNPTGKNKFTVINNEALKGLMSKINDDSNLDLSKDTVSKFKNEDGTDKAAITGNDKVPDPKIGSADTLILIERLQDQGIDTTNKDLRKSIMDYIEGGDNTYYDELLNPPEVEIIPEEKVQPLMGKDEV